MHTAKGNSKSSKKCSSKSTYTLNEQKDLIFIAGSQAAYCQVIDQSHDELATHLTHIIVEYARKGRAQNLPPPQHTSMSLHTNQSQLATSTYAVDVHCVFFHQDVASAGHGMKKNENMAALKRRTAR